MAGAATHVPPEHVYPATQESVHGAPGSAGGAGGGGAAIGVGFTHVLMHSSSGGQVTVVLLSHVAPVATAGRHWPQAAPLFIEHSSDWHCSENTQLWFVVRDPAITQGGAAPATTEPQSNVFHAAPHATSSAGCRFEPGEK